MSSSSSRKQRRLEKKGSAGNVAMVGHRSGMSMAGAMAGAGGALGAVADIKAQMGAFMVAAEQVQQAAKEFEGVQNIARQVDIARELAAKALEEFAGFEYELTKQRFVTLRVMRELVGQAYSPEELIAKEESFRAEYDAVQALVLLVTNPALVPPVTKEA